MKKSQGAVKGIAVAGALAIIALGNGSVPLGEAIAYPQQQSNDQSPPRPDDLLEDAPEDPGEEIPGEPGFRFQYAPVNFPAGAFDEFERREQTKLGTTLDNVREIYSRQGSLPASVYARQHGMSVRDGAVLVRVDTGLPLRGMRLRDASSRAIVDEVLADLGDVGGRVRNVVGPHIEAWISPAGLEELALSPGVRSIRIPWRMKADATSEGRNVIGADQWEGIIFRGPSDGLNIGVIDTGYQDYTTLLGRDLPATERVFTRDFTDDADIEGDTEHGAAVAEIIHDIEPGTTMYLARVSTTGDINQAIDWMIENQVDAINMSLGCVGCGPGDGSGSIIDIVERAPAAGIPFVTSAGNEADRHWIGEFVDSDGDGFHEFAPGDESNAFSAQAGDEVSVVMNWDFVDWFASSQDFDLLLLDSQDRIVAQSRFLQVGFAGQFAEEEVFITVPFSDTFHVVIQRVAATLPETLEIYVDIVDKGVQLQYVVPDQSLSLPADSEQVIALGAVRWSNDQVEPFSSRGPTKDGRMKPDFGAPDGVSTESFGPVGFFGTSAAAPHMVGAIALLHGRLGVVTPLGAINIIRGRTRDLPPEGPDNLSGLGRISLVPPNQD